MWPNHKLLDLIGTKLPLIQAPMAGASGSEMAIEVCEAGGLGSLPCAMLDASQVQKEIGIIRRRTNRPLNLNFLCHSQAMPDPACDAAWKERFAEYYTELGVDISSVVPTPNRSPFDEAMCVVVEENKPEIVSFHFGLPEQSLLKRVKDCGCIVLGSATTVTEALWLETHGCDAIIAQGYEAGGHRGTFLEEGITTQPGTFALVPQVVEAVKIPVIAAGGIANGRGIVAAFALGAAGIQIGTAYLLSPESLISDLHRDALLLDATDNKTTLTNLFSGKPARGLMNRVMMEVGPMSELAPAFPTAGAALAPLRAKAEAAGATDFSPLWAGQSAALSRVIGAGDLTRQLALEAEEQFRFLTTTD